MEKKEVIIREKEGFLYIEVNMSEEKRKKFEEMANQTSGAILVEA